MPSDPPTKSERTALGVTIAVASELSGVNGATWSLSENGIRRPSARAARRMRETIDRLRALLRTHKGVKLNMRDVRFLRRALREMSDGKPPVPIPQVFGRDFIGEWSSRSGVTPGELNAIAQLRLGVSTADLISAPCQRWLASWMSAIDAVLAGDYFATFTERFPSRESALADLADKAFSEILRTAGRERILHYMRGLMLTGELRAAPRDETEN